MELLRWKFPAVLLVASLFACAPSADSARILAIFQLNAKSHFVMYEPLLKALAAKGHQVDVVGHFPQKSPVPNYRDLSLQGLLPDITNNVTYDVLERNTASAVLELFWRHNVEVCELALKSEPVQRLLRSEEASYDLVMTEVFSVECMAPFARRFGAPLVSLQSSVPMHWAFSRMGNPDNPAYMPSYFGTYTDRMSLSERVGNTLLGMVYSAGYNFYLGRTDELCRRYFGEDMPPLWSLVANTSLLIVNSHPSLNSPTPLVPGIVEVAGMHLRPPNPLPQDLERFMNESEHGVIYFSLGSMMCSESLPPARLQALVSAFDALPQRVIWKVGKETVPGLSPHKYWISKWLPQADVLHHPNLRLFVTHGGLLSTLEAVDAGVPMVGLPLHSDQEGNMRTCQRKGVAQVLRHVSFTADEALQAMRSVLSDPSYREKAARLSHVFRDRPQRPLDTAVFWTEYVIRHRGAQHLRSAAVDLPLAQLLLLDVAAVLAASCVLIFAGLWFVGRALGICICRRRDTRLRDSSKKTK